MNIKIKRIDKSLPLPKFETEKSVGFDLLCREDTKIESKGIVYIPANVIVEVPDGYMLILASRSSTPKKKGLSVPHGIGIIDQDYCGEEDEIKVQVYNFTDETVLIKKGERIAQGVFVRINKFDFAEVDKMKEESRGGFGSTGN
jgi:dUTP pyrophosphatase